MAKLLADETIRLLNSGKIREPTTRGIILSEAPEGAAIVLAEPSSSFASAADAKAAPPAIPKVPKASCKKAAAGGAKHKAGADAKAKVGKAKAEAAAKGGEAKGKAKGATKLNVTVF